MLRLFNPGKQARKVTLDWAADGPKQVRLSGPGEAAGEPVSGPVELTGQGIVTLRCTR